MSLVGIPRFTLYLLLFLFSSNLMVETKSLHTNKKEPSSLAQPQSDLNHWKEKSAVIIYHLPGLLIKNVGGKFTVRVSKPTESKTMRNKYGTDKTTKVKTMKDQNNEKKYGTHRTRKGKTMRHKKRKNIYGSKRFREGMTMRHKKRKKGYGSNRSREGKITRDERKKTKCGLNRTAEAKIMKNTKQENKYGIRIMKLKAK